MCDKNSFSHLTLEERRIILTGILNGSSKTAIAQTIGKDKSTVGKEIKLHRYLSHKCSLPWNVPLTKNAPTAGNAPRTATASSLSIVPGVTAPRGPATAAANGTTAGSTSSPTPQRTRSTVTGKPWSIPGWG